MHIFQNCKRIPFYSIREISCQEQTTNQRMPRGFLPRFYLISRLLFWKMEKVMKLRRPCVFWNYRVHIPVCGFFTSSYNFVCTKSHEIWTTVFMLHIIPMLWINRYFQEKHIKLRNSNYMKLFRLASSRAR